MCGIVGLLIKKPMLRKSIGALAMPMLVGMTERGPDSAGMAIFRQSAERNSRKYSLYSPTSTFDWNALWQRFAEIDKNAQVTVKENHAILVSALDVLTVKAWFAAHYSSVHLLSVGCAIEVYKDIGLPEEIARRYDLSAMCGTHFVGHTRMATESAVTPARAHPFTAGEDWCLVHNGSLSNPHNLRRQLEHKGMRFETDNDTEVACRFLEWRLREGDDLQEALKRALKALDGFFTLLMGTGNQLALVRDPFACKPAVVAEHDDYVAIASEFRSLAQLPDIKHAKIFEPMPEEIYIWNV